MTLKKFKNIALGLAAYAAAVYLVKISNEKLDGVIEQSFGDWTF